MGKLIRFFARYAKPFVPHYLVGFAALFTTNYALVRIPALIGEALNVLAEEGAAALQESRDFTRELIFWGVALMVVRTLSRVLFFNPGREIEFRLGNDLFTNLLRLQRPFFLRRKVGELVSVATNDTQSVRLLVGFAGLQVCNVAVAIPMHIFQMANTDWVLTLWCVAPVVLGGLYMRWTIQRFYAMVRRSLELLAKLSDRVLETYAGVSALRVHAAEDAAQARFEETNEEYLELQLAIARIRAFSMPVLGFSGFIGTGFVLLVGGQRVVDGHMGVGDMATFTTLLVSMVGLLTALAWVLAAISRGTIALGRVSDLLSEEPDLPAVREGMEEFELSEPPTLRIEGLTFRYPSAGDGESEREPALENISASVPAGGTLGIFGRTGAGKTTLIELLSRIYCPEPGTVFLDDQDVVSMPIHRLRSFTAVVPQTPFLFSTTLRDNVRLVGERTAHRGTEDARSDAPVVGSKQAQSEGEAFQDIAAHAGPDPLLRRVLADACLEDDLDQLPEGLDTVVGERGVMLSGGQRQRAALARALYRRPKVLLLDDVLSAVDQRTEARLVSAIRGLSEGHGEKPPTTVVVSHRTSVLEHADEILVLDGGRVLERGTHDELLALGGHYADAHAHQKNEGGER